MNDTLRRLGTAQSMRRINGWLTIFWVIMVPVSYAMGWLASVTYVSALSLWALVSGHWSAWQAARVEVRQAEDDDVADVVQEIDRLHRRLKLLQAMVDDEPTSKQAMRDLDEAAGDESR